MSRHDPEPPVASAAKAVVLHDILDASAALARILDRLQRGVDRSRGVAINEVATYLGYHAAPDLEEAEQAVAHWRAVVRPFPQTWEASFPLDAQPSIEVLLVCRSCGMEVGDAHRLDCPERQG
jgi:hypothetical protein